MNVLNCAYDLVRDVGQDKFNYRLSEDDEENWDLYWHDFCVTPNFLVKMKHHQKANHFAGMFNLAKKSALCKNLVKMKKALPLEYDFFPQTWILPYELSDFK